MRSSVLFLLMLIHGITHAADKIPLETFLSDIHNSLYSVGRQDSNQSVRPIIKNVHVEVRVVVEKDAEGNALYYVFDGPIDNENVVTHKIAFDMELPNQSAVIGNKPAARVYSTRRRVNRYGEGRNEYPTRYPYPERYMPDIYPLILFDEHP